MNQLLIRADNNRKTLEGVQIPVYVVNGEALCVRVCPVITDRLHFLDEVTGFGGQVQAVGNLIPVLIQHPKKSSEVKATQ